ncbi:uncharacterized protein ACRADG_006955 [Cochliomyia hominivorax]
MSQNNKIMEKSKSLTDRLKAIKLENHVIKEKPKNESATKDLEEYPKLRKPKPATLLKIQQRQKKSNNIIESKAETYKEEIQVPLRQEFLNKKLELEQATQNFLKNYEVYKNPNKVYYEENYWDPEEPQPLTLHNHVEIDVNELNLNRRNSSDLSTNKFKPLNFIEQHVVGIIYTKVNAHPNGFFAENLPIWYKKTFDKEIPAEWFELVKRSQQFYIENIQNKIVLYPKDVNDMEEKEDISNKDLDLKASGDKAVDKEGKKIMTSSGDHYKHLQKSLKEIKQQQNAGRDGKLNKPKDRWTKAPINKKNNLVKK